MEINNNFNLDLSKILKANRDMSNERLAKTKNTSETAGVGQTQETDTEPAINIQEGEPVKEGEKGSLSYLKNLIKDFDESQIAYYKYDDNGRITGMGNMSNSDIHYTISYADNGDVTVECAGFVQYVRNLPTSTTYHTDGSYDVTDDDGKVTKFDKDGKEIKDSGETPKVKEGDKGSLSYLKNLMGNIVEGYLESYHVDYYEYDDKGRIISMSNCDASSGRVSNSDLTYKISYADNGDVTVKCYGFVQSYKGLPTSTTYHTDGSYDVTNKDGKVQKFDKDGKEIKDSPPAQTAQTKPTQPTIPGWGSGSTGGISSTGNPKLKNLWSFRGVSFLQSIFQPIRSFTSSLFGSFFRNFFYRR